MSAVDNSGDNDSIQNHKVPLSNLEDNFILLHRNLCNITIFEGEKSSRSIYEVDLSPNIEKQLPTPT